MDYPPMNAEKSKFKNLSLHFEGFFRFRYRQTVAQLASKLVFGF